MSRRSLRTCARTLSRSGPSTGRPFAKLLARARDRKAAIVKQVLDLQHHLHVLPSIDAMPGLALLRAPAIGNSVSQNRRTKGFHACKFADFSNLEEKLVRNLRFMRRHCSWHSRFSVHVGSWSPLRGSYSAVPHARCLIIIGVPVNGNFSTNAILHKSFKRKMKLRQLVRKHHERRRIRLHLRDVTDLHIRRQPTASKRLLLETARSVHCVGTRMESCRVNLFNRSDTVSGPADRFSRK